MSIFSVCFVFIFGAGPYRSRSQDENNKPELMRFWSAALHTMNYIDVCRRAYAVLSFTAYFRERKLEKSALLDERRKASDGSNGETVNVYTNNSYANTAAGNNIYGIPAFVNNLSANNPYFENTYPHGYENNARVTSHPVTNIYGNSAYGRAG